MAYICTLSQKMKEEFELQTKIVSEYDQEIPQSQTADNPVAPTDRRIDRWMDGWAGPIITYLDYSFENENIIKLKGQQIHIIIKVT